MYSSEQQIALQQLTSTLLSTFLPPTAEELRSVLRYHDWRYYVLSEPIITDTDYDFLFKALKTLEEKNPDLITPDSPTQRVAKGLTEDFQPVDHLVSMLSLENTYNIEEVTTFENRVKELVMNGDVEYCIEPKFDGASIALVYENDLLIRAATRGDGTTGEEITNNAKAIASVPLSAPFSKYGIYKIELRGEVVIQKDVFEQKNKERVARGEKAFQNPRNTASGSLRMKDPKEVAQRGLQAIMYHISYAVDKAGQNLIGTTLLHHFDNIKMIAECGFKSPIQEVSVCKTTEATEAFLAKWIELRYTFPIETDGMVIKVNSLKQQQQCGSTAHHPKWAVAYKFPAKQAHSKLLSVDFQVGRTGAITPVAKIEPVHLSGVTISSISLHNEDMIREKGIMLGDTLIVERAGEVIPYIVGVVPGLRNGSEQPLVFPSNCPSCESPLIRPNEEVVWRCENADCPAQLEERIIHFVSKEAMDIDGLGRQIVIDFIANGLLKNIEGIYALDFETIRTLEGWGEKSIENLKNGIEQSKKRPLWRLLVAIGIRHVGTGTAKDIAGHILSIHELSRKTVEDLVAIEGIGPKVANSIHDFFTNEANIHLIHDLEQLGLNTINNPAENTPASNKLNGQTFLFTGTLTQFGRDRAKQLVEENGGKLLSAVSANLNYLVAGESAGSKLTKAKAIPSIKVITEEEFLSLIA